MLLFLSASLLSTVFFCPVVFADEFPQETLPVAEAQRPAVCSQVETLQTGVTLNPAGHLSPAEVNDDVGLLIGGHLPEPQRRDCTPHTQRLLEDASHFVFAHLPGETHDPVGNTNTHLLSCIRVLESSYMCICMRNPALLKCIGIF